MNKHNSIFSWNVPSVPELPSVLKANGFDAVYLKVADGHGVFYPNRAAYPGFGENVPPALVDELHSLGIMVYGWGFNYGENVQGEIDVAIKQIGNLGLDGYIWDIECRFEEIHGTRSIGERYSSSVKSVYPDIDLGFCSWALYKSPSHGGTWHNLEVAKGFIKYCDFGCPMIYWGGISIQDVDWWISNSYAQWRNYITDNKPLIAAGRAYTGDGGTASPRTMKYFSQAASELGFDGLSWWSLDHAKPLNLLPTLQEINTGFAIPDPLPDKMKYARVLDFGNNLNIRLSAQLEAGQANVRGGLLLDDRVEIIGDRINRDGVTWLPVKIFIAEEYQGETYIIVEEE